MGLALPIVVDNVAAVPNDAFSNFRIAAFQSVGIAAAEAHEKDLLGGRREIVLAGWLEFQSGLPEFVRHLGAASSIAL